MVRYYNMSFIIDSSTTVFIPVWWTNGNTSTSLVQMTKSYLSFMVDLSSLFLWAKDLDVKLEGFLSRSKIKEKIHFYRMFDWLVGWFYNMSTFAGLCNAEVFVSFFQAIVGSQLMLIIRCKQLYPQVSKVGDLRRGWPEGFLFDSYYTKV